MSALQVSTLPELAYATYINVAREILIYTEANENFVIEFGRSVNRISYLDAFFPEEQKAWLKAKSIFTERVVKMFLYSTFRQIILRTKKYFPVKTCMAKPSVLIQYSFK